ncbi:DUF5518 domain-containing protein [Methanosphaera sp. ISO3-F5]|uniref:DUF5518 domain-containing protein n=1 Tax=Methanosphaera sp. ISO3-F5 TaxID=1452353 RepID=UPI002B25D1F1|nr:DUF5518 domain-containing protein [Methanosphaera sp. ISO3-F5]WQH64303.1 DUF5518 domain-containing protein [Methanosphaera sp. ISO3-F5]
MEFKNIFNDKALPLGVIIIIITYLVSGASSNILPYVFMTSILVGIMKHDSLVESAVVGLVTTFVACLITAIISCGLYFIMYGSAYVTYALSSIIFVFPFYIVLGAIGGAIGYYCAKELGLIE